MASTDDRRHTLVSTVPEAAVTPAPALTPAVRIERIAGSFAPDLSWAPDLIVDARRRALDRLAAGGTGDASLRSACVGLAAELIVALGAEGLLTPDELPSTAAEVARQAGGSVEAARLDLYVACVRDPSLLQ